MALLVAIGTGLCAVGVLIAAGVIGFAIARAGANRPAVATMCAGALLVIGAVAASLGFFTYDRISTVAIVTVPEVSPGQSPSPAFFQPVTDGWLHFESDNGDYIGGGVLKVWTIKESTFTVGGTNAMIRASVAGLGDWWELDFGAPAKAHLWTGQYSNAERWPFAPNGQAGIAVSGDGRGCNTLKGRFAIKTLVWTSAATIAELDVLFEQHCEGMQPALRGELWVTTERGVHRTPPAFSSSVDF